jgi:tetratricopeptide (TPR) repeat protein
MTTQPTRVIKASGTRSVAAGQLGIAVTGDNSQVDARAMTLAAGAIPDPATVVPVAGTQNLPRRPARVFVGRETALSQLVEAMDGVAKAAVIKAIHGLGGIGKSELALQYAYASLARYALVWWVIAEDQNQLQVGLAALARRLCPEIAMAGTAADAAGWALGWLQTHKGWLLILDNVTEPGDVEPLMAQLIGGHILLTTRRDTGWDEVADPIRLDVLGAEPATALLTIRTRQYDDASRSAAESVATELGYLPLALEQAAAYVIQTRISLASYLGRLRQQPETMYASTGGGPAQWTISRVWDITVDAIRARNHEAIAVLQTLACYSPDDIPRAMLGDSGFEDSGIPGQLAVDEALGLLASYSMITLTVETISIHRLVQAVIRGMPQQGLSHGYSHNDLAFLLLFKKATVNASDAANWPLLRMLAPHAETMAVRYLSSDPQKMLMLAQLQNTIGILRGWDGEYSKAIALHSSAVRMAEEAVGHDHVDLADLLGWLASAHRDAGRAAEALVLEERALRITETALGPDDTKVAGRLSALAFNYLTLLRPAEALPLRERALRITETAFGQDDPRVAEYLSNLGGVYRDLQRPAEALPLEERALQITEAVYGPDHPEVATRLGWLAAVYRDLQRPAEALPLEERALQITEAVMGADHHRVADRLGFLATTYHDLERRSETVPLGKRALRITEAAYGPDHPRVADRLGFLATTYRGLEHPAEALPLEQRALRITEAAYGPDQPEVAARLDRLASTYRGLEQPAEALPLEQRALRITEAAYGPDHPEVAVRLGLLAITYRDLEQPAEALPLEQRALRITEAVYGPDHPKVADRLDDLSFTYRELGRVAEALPLRERALRITEAAYGPNQLEVANRLRGVGFLYWALDRPAEALPLEERALRITEEAYGPDHPKVGDRLKDLAYTYRDLGRLTEASLLDARIARIRGLND